MKTFKAPGYFAPRFNAGAVQVVCIVRGGYLPLDKAGVPPDVREELQTDRHFSHGLDAPCVELAVELNRRAGLLKSH
jgi:hypothetical protein